MMNLLNVRWIKYLLKSRWFPIIPQLIMLVILGLLITGGMGVTTDDAALAKQLRNTNLANLLVWSYWWPLVIIAGILLGRMWCMVCPMELITSIAGRIGFRRKVPNFFRSGWVITILYTLVLIVGVHTLAIHRLPHRMALYLLMLIGVAVLVGLIFQKRTFCTYVCPVGYLLGLYALVSPLEWRADDLSVCKGCKSKDCITKKNQYRLFSRSCTSNLYPATIKDNQQCLLCTQCLKSCPNDNIRFSLRKPFEDFFKAVELNTAQVGFVLLMSGFVVYEILSEWPVSKVILKWVPNHLVDVLNITGPAAGFVSAIVMFVLFPAILLSVVIGLAKIRSEVSSAVIAKAFALLLLPSMAAAHVLKSVLKMNSRIPYWHNIASDLDGVETAKAILNKSLVLDKSIPNSMYPAISFLAAALLIVALVATLLIIRKSAAMRKLDPAAKVFLLLGTLTYWGIFALTILKWRF